MNFQPPPGQTGPPQFSPPTFQQHSGQPPFPPHPFQQYSGQPPFPPNNPGPQQQHQHQHQHPQQPQPNYPGPQQSQQFAGPGSHFRPSSAPPQRPQPASQRPPPSWPRSHANQGQDDDGDDEDPPSKEDLQYPYGALCKKLHRAAFLESLKHIPTNPKARRKKAPAGEFEDRPEFRRVLFRSVGEADEESEEEEGDEFDRYYKKRRRLEEQRAKMDEERKRAVASGVCPVHGAFGPRHN